MCVCSSSAPLCDTSWLSPERRLWAQRPDTTFAFAFFQPVLPQPEHAGGLTHQAPCCCSCPVHAVCHSGRQCLVCHRSGTSNRVMRSSWLLQFHCPCEGGHRSGCAYASMNGPALQLPSRQPLRRQSCGPLGSAQLQCICLALSRVRAASCPPLQSMLGCCGAAGMLWHSCW